MPLPSRKAIRIPGYDYSMPGYYFITVCTRNKEKLLCDIVGTGLLDGPQVRLLECGRIVKKQLEYMRDFYPDIKIDKYTIMPNHIHMILYITEPEGGPSGRPVPTAYMAVGGASGPSGRPVPTANSKVSRFVGTLKRFCNRAYGADIWQHRSYDHVIRGEADYQIIWQYIENNPAKWAEDRFYAD